MARDPDQVRRNLLVIPGALLAFYAMLVALYAHLFRVGGSCPSSAEFSVLGACLAGALVALPLVALGGVLIVIGYVLHRPRRDQLVDLLYPGTGVHTSLALLESLVIFPVVIAAVLDFQDRARGTPRMVDVFGNEMALAIALEATALVALLVLIPFFALYARWNAHRNMFLRAVWEEEEEFGEPTPPSGRRAAPQEADGTAKEEPEEA